MMMKKKKFVKEAPLRTTLVRSWIHTWVDLNEKQHYLQVTINTSFLQSFIKTYQAFLKEWLICGLLYIYDIDELEPLHFFQLMKWRCLWNTMPPAATESEKAIFRTKVKVKVTRSLTLVSFERASLVEYACQIWSLCLLQFKSYSEC